MLRIKIIFIFLMLIVSSNVCAENKNMLKILHGIQLDQCKHIEGCDKGKIQHCEQVTKTAFKNCDKYISKDSQDNDQWSGCMSDYLMDHLGQETVLQFMMFPECDDGDNHSAQNDSSKKKNAPQYFVVNSADITDPHLMPSPMSACRYGAEQLMIQMKKNTPQVSMHIEIDDARKSYSISGEGEEIYNHLFGTTTYTYGECVGRAETTFVEDYMGNKAGDVIKSDFEDTLYVVVDCSGKSKDAVCE